MTPLRKEMIPLKIRMIRRGGYPRPRRRKPRPRLKKR